MVLKSTKSKSKRSTLRHKYKVIKKVKEHHKKKLKEEKKRKKQGLKPKKQKDPGVPTQWPFKEELLKDLEWQKQRILAKEKARKEENKRKRVAEAEEAREDANMDALDALTPETVQDLALQKQAAFAKKEARLARPSAAQDRDGSRRAFFKEFMKVVAASDVIIQVLDARDPLGSRCKDVERFVMKAGATKRIILLLNKIDLVPKEVTEAWLKYLREELPTVPFKCSTQQQTANLNQSRMSKRAWGRRTKAVPSAAATQASNALGAEPLLQLLKNYARNKDIKTAVSVGIVGLPNVGKSSLINSLKRAKVAQIGNAPGVTRTVQEITLDKHITLIDSPGIVFSAGQPGDAWAALRNCIRVEQVDDPQSIAAEVVRRCPAKQLMALYAIPAFETAEEFLQQVAFKRGRLLPGGIGDATTAAQIVLHDWHNGKIAYYTMPPRRGGGEHEHAEIVSQWAEEFDADKVYGNEASVVIAGLPSKKDTFIETETVGVAPVDIAKLQAESSEGDEAAPSADSSDSDADSQLDGDLGDAKASIPCNPAASAKQQAAAQAQKLYTESGQFNPHLARADKKRRKKQKRLKLGDDFDFAEAFADEVQLSDQGEEAKDQGDESRSLPEE